MYYLLEDDFGTQSGLIDEYNPAPMNAKTYKTLKELEKAQEEAGERIEKANEKFMAEVEQPIYMGTVQAVKYQDFKDKSVSSLTKKYKEKELIEIGKDLGLELDKKDTKASHVEKIKSALK